MVLFSRQPITANDQDVVTSIFQNHHKILSYEKFRLFALKVYRKRTLRRTQSDLLTFCLYLEYFLKGGLPLLDGLGEMRQTWVGPFQRVLEDLYHSVRQGSLLSEALTQYPEVFDHLFIKIIRVGEATGDLWQSFAMLEGYLKQKAQWRLRITQGLRYPLFVCVILFGSCWSLMSFLVPSLCAFFIEQNMPLPMATQSLIFFFQYAQYVIGGIGVCGCFLWLWRSFSQAGSFFWNRMCWSLPGIGPLYQKIALYPILYSLSLLIGQSLHILEGLKIAKKGILQPFLANKVSQIEQDILAGQHFFQALDHSQLMPKALIRLVKVGEETGSLGRILSQVADLYHREIQKKIDSLISFIEPVLITCLGGLLLWLVIGTLLPIYESFDSGYVF